MLSTVKATTTFGQLLVEIQERLTSWGIDPSSLKEALEKSSASQSFWDSPCSGACSLKTATSSQVAVLHNPSYLRAAVQSQAGLLIISPSLLSSFLSLSNDKREILVCDHALFAFQAALEHFSPPCQLTPCGPGAAFIDESASIHPTAIIGAGCTIGPFVKIGERTKVLSGSHIYQGTQIGKECTIHSAVVIRENCLIKDRVIIQPSAVIGSCGFGYSQYQGRHIKLSQLSHVVVEEDVEIGANCTIDRGHVEPTVIGKGTKIDNLVQVGHGAQIGPYNLIIGQAGIAGSTKTGSYVTLAGQVGVSGHIEIADKCTVAAQSGVTKSLLHSGVYAGTPAVPITEWRKEQVLIKKLASMLKELKELHSQPFSK